MSDPIVVLPEDITGLLAGNTIQGERHSPFPGSIRLLIPKFGAFFATGFRLFDPLDNSTIAPSKYQLVDLWQLASERAGKAVHNAVLITDPMVSVEVGIDYQAFGGPHSRNALELVNWLALRRQASNETLAFAELLDIPKQFESSDHLHLLSHVYGFDKVVSSVGNIRSAMLDGADGAWREAQFNIDQSIERLQTNATVMVESLVMQKYNEWKAQINLFNLGLDLVYDYPMLDQLGAEAAVGAFTTPAMEDDRYVNVVGLGAFSKALVERCILAADTGLGYEFAQMGAPNRGSVYAAKVGATFTLPTPAVGVTVLGAQMSVYPKDYPLTDTFVVHKLAGHERTLGCILMGFNPTTGEAYLGMLQRAATNEPLTWKRFYFQDDLVDLEALVSAHVLTNNNPHEVTKFQLELGLVENLPVVTVDDIMARTGTRKYVTMDGLMYHMRAFMENATLERNPDGLVDLTKNPMSDAKIVFAPFKASNAGYDGDGVAIPPKDQFISSFCDGTDKYTRFTDGAGSFTDRMTQADSDDCKYFNVPKQGDNLGDFCEGKNKMTKYADGKGGIYKETVRVNDPECGYVAPPNAGATIATFCSGVNQMVRYADGKGGFYDLPSMINTYLCGGTINAGTGTGTGAGTGDPTTPGNIVISLSSTHDKIYAGTSEVISIRFTGLTPALAYQAEGWIKSPALNAGADFMTTTIDFTAGADGTYVKEIEAFDDGSTVPRGVYDNWIKIPSESKVSNHITRTFYAGEGSVIPTNTPTPTAAPGDLGVDGLPYDPTLWPPAPKYDPKIDLSTSTLVISPGTSEQQQIVLTGFFSNTSYTLSGWIQSPAFNNNAPTVAVTKTIITDATGSFIFNNNVYDDGTTPRGDYLSWVSIGTTDSNIVMRQFVTVGTSTGYKYDPKIVFASTQATLSAGVSEVQTFVMTGFEKSTAYTIEWRVTDNTSWLPSSKVVLTMTVRTDDNGYCRYEHVSVDDGITVPRGLYESFVLARELNLRSNTIFRRFVDAVVTAPPNTTQPRITYTTSHATIYPGTVETINIALSGFPANATFAVDGWIRSPALNNNSDYRVLTMSIATDASGNGLHTIVTTDDGIAVPRGVYQNWCTCAAKAVTSAVVVRTFMAGATTPTPTPAPSLANASVIFSTDHPTISTGVIETLSVNLAKFIPNTTYNVEFWLTSPALGNGGAALKSYTGTVTTNSTGSGIYTLTNPADDGLIVNRGEYRSWIVISGITSNVVIRTFTGTPKPTVPYNPAIVYSTTQTTLSVGVTEVITARLTGFMPNTSYALQGWIRSPALNNNANFLTNTWTVVTDATGAGFLTVTTTDDGITVPRGTYTNWFTAPAIPINSNTVIRYFVGTPAPTAPPYSPAIELWTDRSTLYIGTLETFYIVIGGMRVNTTYTINLWARSDSYNGGVAVNVGSRSMTTNAQGTASLSWSQTDDGTIPRNTWWMGWGVIAETGTQSATNSRYFA